MPQNGKGLRGGGLKEYRALLGIYMAVGCIEGIRALLRETFSRVWRPLFRLGVWGCYD